MRIIETVLVLGLLVAMLSRLVVRRWPWALGRWPAGALAAVTALHLLIEGPRRPMAIGYLLMVVSLLVALRKPVTRPASPSALVGFGRWAVGLVLMALVALPPVLLPVFSLPAPSGPFKVGTTWFPLTDPSRVETLGPSPGGPRAVMVRVWYPAPADAEGRRAPYADPAEVNGGILGLLKFSAVMGNQLEYVKTHSTLDAPVAAEAAPMPVLVFSHGYTGYPAQNTPQMEELASNGYIVFSIAHTYDAGATVFPDGRIVPLDPAILEAMKGFAGDDQSAIAARIARLENAATPDDRRAAFIAFAKNNPPRIEASVPVWAGDTRALLDHLERLTPDSAAGQFAGALDLDRVGIFGMSFGGSNTGEVCRHEPRCKAGINIDGQQFGPLIPEGDSITAPFMILASEAAIGVHRAAFDRLVGPAFLVELKGTQHIGLTDTPLMAPLLFRWLGITGTMAPARSEALMTAWISAFFDRYLRGRPAPLLTQADHDPDIAFQSKNLELSTQ